MLDNIGESGRLEMSSLSIWSKNQYIRSGEIPNRLHHHLFPTLEDEDHTFTIDSSILKELDTEIEDDLASEKEMKNRDDSTSLTSFPILGKNPKFTGFGFNKKGSKETESERIKKLFKFVSCHASALSGLSCSSSILVSFSLKFQILNEKTQKENR